jgi:beta-glucosidase
MQEVTRGALGADFLVGVATSSYQIEGAVTADGRGASIWDRFAHTPGKTKNGDTGDEACDHYRRMPADVDLMASLGIDAYRFSIAWPRVLPLGRGAVNHAGLDFYERLVDALLAKGIAPCATLYHWDLPDALFGGWLARSTCDAFADYAAIVADRLGDRVAMWLTHNEPWCQAFLGYETGLFAPGHRTLAEGLTAAHHLIVSHGLAVQALRSRVKTPIGAALNFMPAHPASERPEDVAAAQRQDGYFNRWFLEPMCGRGYPEDMLRVYGKRMPAVTAEDLTIAAEPIDVLGVNYYERAIVAHDDARGPLKVRFERASSRPRTADREIYPEGLLETLRRLHGEYGVKRLVITENGAAFSDQPGADGVVHDRGRVEFLRAHLAKVLEARQEGIPVDGYFAWSLLDNFEWAEGYSLRYGLVHVDFETQKRTLKDSAHFLRALARR